MSRRCAVCERPTIRDEAAGVEVGPCCAGKRLAVRFGQANPDQPNVYTFYVRSFKEAGEGGTEYIVKRFRRQMTCNCPDFTHRGQVLAVPCKHVRLVRLLARARGSLSQLPWGTTWRFRLPATFRGRR